MSEKDWERFFWYVKQIVDAEPGSFREKTETVRSKAEEHGADTQLEELASWFAEE